MKRKGVAPAFLIALVIALAIAVVAIILVIRGQGIGGQALELSPGQDSRCLQKTQLMEKTGQAAQIVDLDNDGRDDSCDWCICASGKTGCNNNIKTAGGDDTDGDFLPSACDKDDKAGVGRTIITFSDACKPGTNLYELKSGDKQCYIS